MRALNVSATSTIDERTQLPIKKPGRRANPLRPASVEASVAALRGTLGSARPLEQPTAATSVMERAIARQCGQLPAFAPLLDELELAGWSSHRRTLSGNFHDWMMLDGRVIMVAAGHAIGPEPTDAVEAALVAQAAWSTIRAHAGDVCEAGELLSRAASSLWRTPNEGVQAAVVVALLDTIEGNASIAMAGDCLAWRIRAATLEQLTVRQPMLGGVADFSYASQLVQLSLRERLLLVADNPAQRPAKLAATVAANFARLDAESHRRMIAADTLAIVRDQYQRHATDITAPSASIIAVRRR
jgi:hypothetical protein